MFRVVQFDDRQDEDPLQLRQQQEKLFDINEAFDFSQNSDKLRHPSEDGTAEQLTMPSDGASPGSGIGEAIVDVLLQPNVAPVSPGGGGGASGGWRDDDDDDEKNKNHYRPRRRK